MKFKLAILVFLLATIAAALCAQTPESGPMTEKEVEQDLKNHMASEALAAMVRQRGVDFDLTAEIEKKLRKQKADDQLIDAVKNAGPTARAKQPQGGQGAQGPAVSREEGEAFSAIRNELDPDKSIALVSDFEKKYPSSPLLTYAYAFEANAFQQKGDVEKVVEYDDKSLKLKADNLISLISAASMIPQPQYLNKHEAEKEKVLQEAESYANRALQEIEKQVTKQANETDEQFQKRKASLTSGVHGALGMIHLERSSMGLTGPDKEELSKAQQEFKAAVTTSDRPDPRDYYRLGEAYSMDGKVDEAIDAFTKAGDLGQGTAIKTYADQRIEALKKQKAQAAPAKQ
jgi:tetratricopeptide (TPR) repeat protein